MTRADSVLLALVALLLAGVYALLWQPGPGARAQLLSVAQDPVVVPLDAERTITVPGRRGASVVQIAGGKARFVDSPCRGKVCIHAGWQSRAGAYAACLPNGVSLSILGDERRFDAINF